MQSFQSCLSELPDPRTGEWELFQPPIHPEAPLRSTSAIGIQCAYLLHPCILITHDIMESPTKQIIKWGTGIWSEKQAKKQGEGSTGGEPGWPGWPCWPCWPVEVADWRDIGIAGFVAGGGRYAWFVACNGVLSIGQQRCAEVIGSSEWVAAVLPALTWLNLILYIERGSRHGDSIASDSMPGSRVGMGIVLLNGCSRGR